jgi:hypothetical protein
MSRRREANRVLRAALTLALLPMSSAGCGTERSAAAYCHVYAQEKARYLKRYGGQAESVQDMVGALRSLGKAFEAYGDVITMFDRLAKVSPDDVQSDIEAIRDSLKKQRDSVADDAGQPLKGLARGLVLGLTTSGSWRRVDTFTHQHCEKG